MLSKRRFIDRIKRAKADSLRIVLTSGSLHSCAYFDIDFSKPFTVDDWLPREYPKAWEPFCNVDRAVDPCRFAGERYDATDMLVEEAIIDTSMRSARAGGNARLAVLDEKAWNLLANELDHKLGRGLARHHPDGELFLHGSRGEICVIKDDVAPGTGFLLQEDTWTLYENVEGKECLVCTAPGYNVRISNVGRARYAAFSE